MKYLIVILLALSLASCKKESASTNGSYLVTGTEGTKTGNGTIDVNGTVMDVNVFPVMVRSGINFGVSGTTIAIPGQTLGDMYIMTGSGSITPTSITVSVKVMRHSQVFICNFNGSK